MGFSCLFDEADHPSLETTWRPHNTLGGLQLDLGSSKDTILGSRPDPRDTAAFHLWMRDLSPSLLRVSPNRKIEMICGSLGRKAGTKSGLNVHPPADIIVATENSGNSYLYVDMLIFLNVRPVSPNMVDNGFSFRSSAKS